MKHVFITGGSRGIGAALVRAFAGAGYRVTFTYLSSVEAAQVLAQETGALPILADGSDEGAVASAVATAEKEQGGIDILVNNAGIAAFSLFTDITTEEWHRVMGINLDSAFYYTRAALPHMIHNKWGRVINISSIWGITGSACEVHYSTSKAALIGLTKALAKELGPSAITVNCIAPGVIDTDMNKMLDEDTVEALCEETPVGRLGTPEEVASLALYLAGDGAAFLTGQVISPNGGMVI